MVHTNPVRSTGGAANAHAAEDVIYNPITIPVPNEGIILSWLGMDTTDLAIAYDVLVFNKPFTATVDDSPFAMVLADIPNFIGVIEVDGFVAISSDTIGTENNINMPYHAPDGNLYCQLVTAGTPTLVAVDGIFCSLGIWARVQESD